jgi:hypothetical protein
METKELDLSQSILTDVLKQCKNDKQQAARILEEFKQNARKVSLSKVDLCYIRKMNEKLKKWRRSSRMFQDT